MKMPLAMACPRMTVCQASFESKSGAVGSLPMACAEGRWHDGSAARVGLAQQRTAAPSVGSVQAANLQQRRAGMGLAGWLAGRQGTVGK